MTPARTMTAPAAARQPHPPGTATRAAGTKTPASGDDLFVPTGQKPPVMVVLGDSLSAGTQDGSTVRDRQERAYPSLVAAAAGIPFNLPEISRPGLPFQIFGDGRFSQAEFNRLRNLLAVSLAPLALWSYYLGAPPFLYPAVWDMLGTGRRTPESRHSPARPQHSFAIPGMEARHLISIRGARDYLEEIHQGTVRYADVGAEVPLIRATLQNGTRKVLGSQVDQAIAAQPDLVVVWAGGNDALASVSSGYVDDRTLTPVDDRPWTFRDTTPLGNVEKRTTEKAMPGFRSTFTGPEGIITRLLRETDAEIFLFNIPDVSLIPNPNQLVLGQPIGRLPFRVVLEDGTDVTDDLERMVLPNRVRGPGKNGRLVFPPGSRISLTTLLERFVAEGPVRTIQEFRNSLFKISQDGFFSEDEVMDPDELREVQQRIQDYNRILADIADRNPRVHLVDIASEFAMMGFSGRPLRGEGPEIRVTNTYTGIRDARGYEGVFSFDGVHPSDTGHAVIANILLDRIRQDLGTDPRFAAFATAPPIDEKAVFASDPHRGGRARATMTLNRRNVEALERGTH